MDNMLATFVALVLKEIKRPFVGEAVHTPKLLVIKINKTLNSENLNPFEMFLYVRIVTTVSQELI